MLLDLAISSLYSLITGPVNLGKERDIMLSEMMIYEALDDAMSMHAAMNNGKTGFERSVLREAVFSRGGDEADLHEAMITVLKLMLPDASVYLS